MNKLGIFRATLGQNLRCLYFNEIGYKTMGRHMVWWF